MRKIAIFLIVWALSLNANTLHSYFKKVDRVYNIDYKILKTIAKIESNFNPYSIGVLSKTYRVKRLIRHLSRIGVDFNIGKASKGKMQVSIYPTSYQSALEILGYIKKLRIRNYDVGLMQINRVNISSEAEEKALLKSVLYNISKGAKILRYCFDAQKRDIIRTIECYNKGGNIRGRRDYFTKFLREYRRVARY